MKVSDETRFFRRVRMVGATGCLVFNGALNNGGYASFGMQGKVFGAHRAAWLFAGKELVPGMDLDHLCRNRWCVNVEHLEQVSRKTNLNRGKQSSRRDESKCRKGLHDWTDDNVFVDSHGKSRCLQCHTEYHINYRAMRREER